MIVTIDGPAGSGKSSTARLVASGLDAVYMDTGAMYRAVTLIALEKGIDIHDAKRLGDLSSQISITFGEKHDGQAIIMDGRDRSEEIRSGEVDRNVSVVSAHRQVRERLLDLQRGMAASLPAVVVEGRDTGSVVFPDADYKFFLTAGHEARSRRRLEQLGGGSADAERIAGEISERDSRDSSRDIAPLKIPDGAEVIDNTNLSLDETVKLIVRFIGSGGAGRQI
ncbi:MAG: (d)CMP kinase [Nitrospinota bacterium]